MGTKAAEAFDVSYDGLPTYLHANHSVYMEVDGATYYLTDVNDRYWRVQDTSQLNEKGHYVDCQRTGADRQRVFGAALRRRQVDQGRVRPSRVLRLGKGRVAGREKCLPPQESPGAPSEACGAQDAETSVHVSAERARYNNLPSYQGSGFRPLLSFQGTLTSSGAPGVADRDPALAREARTTATTPGARSAAGHDHVSVHIAAGREPLALRCVSEMLPSRAFERSMAQIPALRATTGVGQPAMQAGKIPRPERKQPVRSRRLPCGLPALQLSSLSACQPFAASRPASLFAAIRSAGSG